jgi:hypothetical protein
LSICFFPSAALLIALRFFKIESPDLIQFTLLFGWIALFLIIYKESLGTFKGFIVSLELFYLAYFSTFPLLIWITLVDKIVFIKEFGVWAEISACLVLVLIYALITKGVLNTAGEEGWIGGFKVLKMTALIMVVLVVILVSMAPEFFLTRVANLGGIREYKNQTSWRHVDESEYFKFKPLVNINGIKTFGDDKYFCSYSIWNFGGSNILCPFDEANPNSTTCIAFESKK